MKALPREIDLDNPVYWLRQRAGITQADLARKLQISRAAVAQLEARRGNVRIDTLLRVARVLGKKR